jgi:hypothetical protein
MQDSGRLGRECDIVRRDSASLRAAIVRKRQPQRRSRPGQVSESVAVRWSSCQLRSSLRLRAALSGMYAPRRRVKQLFRFLALTIKLLFAVALRPPKYSEALARGGDIAKGKFRHSFCAKLLK